MLTTAESSCGEAPAQFLHTNLTTASSVISRDTRIKRYPLHSFTLCISSIVTYLLLVWLDRRDNHVYFVYLSLSKSPPVDMSPTLLTSREILNNVSGKTAKLFTEFSHRFATVRPIAQWFWRPLLHLSLHIAIAVKCLRKRLCALILIEVPGGSAGSALTLAALALFTG